jgi:hypothetical protein
MYFVAQWRSKFIQGDISGNSRATPGIFRFMLKGYHNGVLLTRYASSWPDEFL